jgi:hypothetical protein
LKFVLNGNSIDKGFFYLDKDHPDFDKRLKGLGSELK